MVFVIAYDLRSPNDTAEDYERVIASIKANFTWCHLQKSVWLVDSALSASEIRESIKPTLYNGDELFVARLHGNWASWALGDRRNDWLRKRSF
jgi:hypothetical protein